VLPRLPPRLVQAVQVDVGQQGRDDPALWRSRLRMEQPFLGQDIGAEPAGEKLQQPSIAHPLPYEGEQLGVIEMIEGRHDTLPTSRCRDSSGSFGHIIRLKGNRSKSSAASIDKVGCV
jgi:hypothetical protein